MCVHFGFWEIVRVGRKRESPQENLLRREEYSSFFCFFVQRQRRGDAHRVVAVVVVVVVVFGVDFDRFVEKKKKGEKIDAVHRVSCTWCHAKSTVGYVPEDERPPIITVVCLTDRQKLCGNLCP